MTAERIEQIYDILDRHGNLTRTPVIELIAEINRLQTFDLNESVNAGLRLAAELATERKRNESLCELVASLVERSNAVRDQRDGLLTAAKETIVENLHLADGDVCTLMRLKKAIANAETP